MGRDVYRVERIAMDGYIEILPHHTFGGSIVNMIDSGKSYSRR